MITGKKIKNQNNKTKLKRKKASGPQTWTRSPSQKWDPGLEKWNYKSGTRDPRSKSWNSSQRWDPEWKSRTLAVCFEAILDIYSLIPFFKPKNTFFTSTNAIFNIIAYTHSFCTFNTPPPQNRYTRNQPIHFSMIPKIQIKKKVFFEILNLKKSVCLKKLRLNLKQKIKLYFRNTHF